MSGDEELTVSDTEQYIDNATSAYTEANDFYQLLMENNLMKIASLSFAILAAIIGPLMISGIIWYRFQTYLYHLLKQNCTMYIH
jgi:hypothetical protein